MEEIKVGVLLELKCDFCCDGGRRGVGLYNLCGGVRDRWRSASVACCLVSRGRLESEAHFYWGLSGVRLGSGYILSVHEYFYRGASAEFKFQVGLEVGVR